MGNFEIIIGVEVHLELNTKSKLFSSASNVYTTIPNSQISYIDLAYPGTLPNLNKEAIKKAIKLSKALNMSIDNLIRFDRKHYFYTDIPKNFQITQHFYPIGQKGFLLTKNNFKVLIDRIHLEEDTAKQIHKNNITQIDYNRSGAPLIEVVTEPIFRNADQVVDYLVELRLIAIFLNISDAKMENGSFRTDINISIRPYGQSKLGNKVEIKNLNSLSNVEKAIKLEIHNQVQLLLTGKEVTSCTKRFDEQSQNNIIMRSKMEEIDYRYFPEPNIPPIKLTKNLIDSIKIKELPNELRHKLLKKQIPYEYIDQIISNKDIITFFNGDYNLEVVKLFFACVLPLSTKRHVSVNLLPININHIIELIQLEKDGLISNKHIKKIIELIDDKITISEIIEIHKMKQISSSSELTKIIQIIINENNDIILQYKQRQERVEKFIMGEIMKRTKGQANPVLSNQIMKKILGEIN